MANQNGSNQNDMLAAASREMLARYAPLRVSGEGIRVDAQTGTVILSGSVRSHAVKETAEQLTRQVKGVSAVENRLIVDDDVEIAVAQALAGDSRTRAGFPGILVGVVYGVAFLKGNVASAEIKNAAGEIAEKISGVLRVSNELIAPAGLSAKPTAAKVS